MKILFVHQNFPGQYLHLARFLSADPSHEVVFITQRKAATLPRLKTIRYQPSRRVTPNLHHYLVDAEAGILNAQAVVRVALDLKQSGFVPDVMLGHNGWGEIWYLKEVYPQAPLLGYFEFFYHLRGADVDFDPAVSPPFDSGPRLRTKNLGNLMGLDAVDLGQCPTEWQKSLYPKRYQSLLHVMHDGVDTRAVTPDATAHLRIPNTDIDIACGDEIVTYVGRNLEPYRGFPQLMRSLPTILSQRPNARVLIVGGDEISYGARLPGGRTYKQALLSELGDSLDLNRVHFLGKVPYSVFLKILQVSCVHVYLTYPFVLSWSMLEAMSAGCVIVGSKTQPVEEVVRHGENGLLVDFFSPEQIADRVIDVLKEPRAFASLRHNARQTIVNHYDLQTICLPAHLQLLRMLADR
ncbi:glycosyltransferase family 4 protein [Pseudomonas sp. FEN]|uniref:glycosyltransferase family 4 protein n=1 Tax=Pseudomonas sp. FEN TaxID=2767468 RepID=UPI001748207F|nr:glycosyltransferase family 4 protein [Pseudomonas sp. FEN]CAD5199457.1 Putative glycosyltransferase [Pseudomonas sp. FEN]